MTEVQKQCGLGCEKVVVPGVFLLLLVAYLLSIPGIWFIHSDSAHYLGLGRSLAAGEGYTFNGAPYGKYPPGFPLMIAAVHWTVGEGIWAIQAIGALCGIGAAFVTYLVVKAREGWVTGLAVAVLTATCPWFWSHACVYVLSGIPHAFVALLALWLVEREVRSSRFSPWRWLLAALCAVSAVLTHMSAAALGAALAAGALLAKGQSRPVSRRLAGGALVFVLCTGAAAAWMSYGRYADVDANYSNLTSSEPMDMVEDPFPKLRNRASEWAATPLGMEPDDLPWPAGLALLAVFVLPGLIWAFRRYRNCAEFYVCAHFLIMFVHGGMGGKERYVLAVLPLLFYYGALSVRLHGAWLVRLLGLTRAGREGRRQRLARAGMVCCFLALLLPALYGHHRGKGGSEAFSESKQEMQERRGREWREAAAALDRVASKDAVVQAGPRGDWATLHYFIRRRVGKLHPRERGMQVVERILDCGATYALPHKHSATRMGIMVVIKTYRDCFERLYVTDDGRLRLYRIHPDRLRKLYEDWRAGGRPDPLQPEPGEEEVEVWEDDGFGG